jgi:uncharacterized RmlC-like cupin family protein
MQRSEAISGRSAGSRDLWVGRSRVAPGVLSANHHHGRSESAIFVVSGRPEFVYLDPSGAEVRLSTEPGDFVYVPAWVPHREENPDPDEDAVVVLARTTQEGIVVNVENLQWAGIVELERFVPGD